MKNNNPFKIAILSPPFSGHAKPLWVLSSKLKEDENLQILFFDYFTNKIPFNGDIDTAWIPNTFNDDLYAASQKNNKELLPSLADFYSNIYNSTIDKLKEYQPDLIIVDHFFGIGESISKELGIPYVVAYSSPDIYLVDRTQKSLKNKMELMIEKKKHKSFNSEMKTRTGYHTSIFAFSELNNICFFPKVIVDWNTKVFNKDNFLSLYDSKYYPTSFLGTTITKSIANEEDIQFKNELKSSKKKKILISFGTVWLRQLGGENTIQKFEYLLTHILSALDNPDYHIVYSGIVELFDKVTKNVNTSAKLTAKTFINQPYLLEEFDLIIFHGGFNTFTECVASEVPMLVFPIGFDQGRVADTVERFKVGERLPFSFNSTDTIQKKIIPLVEDPKYKTALKKISPVFKSGLDVNPFYEIINKIKISSEQI